MIYHPHVHYLVPDVGVSDNGSTWVKGNKKSFLPVKALSKIFRAMFRDTLKEVAPELFAPIPKFVWKIVKEPVLS
ncbi:transposase, partial [candidate division KSB1 bacterium]|nr:transposase [candidate division KSB1 bacterium]